MKCACARFTGLPLCLALVLLTLFAHMSVHLSSIIARPGHIRSWLVQEYAAELAHACRYGVDVSDPSKMVDELEDHLKAVHDKYGKNIWLTEFALLGFSQVPLTACSNSPGTTQVANFTCLSGNKQVSTQESNSISVHFTNHLQCVKSCSIESMAATVQCSAVLSDDVAEAGCRSVRVSISRRSLLMTTRRYSHRRRWRCWSGCRSWSATLGLLCPSLPRTLQPTTTL